jgi:hemolysin activation/secretion protein
MAADTPPIPPAEPPQAAIVAPAAQNAQPIVVDSNGYHYQVTGSTLVPIATVQSIIESAPGPKEALEGLNRAYQTAGYFLVAIGAQVQEKLVAIRVVEGRITEKEISDGLAPYYAGIEDRAGLTRNELIRRTAMAELYAARQGMRPKINFTPGSTLGGTKVAASEEPIAGAKQWNAGLGFNNLGSRYSSRYTAAANGAVRPGGGLELTASYTQGIPGLSDDSAGSSYHAAVIGGSIVTPWGLYGLSYTSIDYVIGEVTAPLFPSGEIRTAAINGTQLAFANDTARWTFTESLSRIENLQTGFEGLYMITDQNYNVASVGTGYNQSFALLGQNANIGVGITVSKGFSDRAGTFLPDNPGVPNPRFALVQANASYSQALPAGYTAGVTLSGQYADSTVPQNQQWVLGGFGNLTAWLPAALVGDSGALARVTVNSPGWAWEGAGMTLSAGAFLEGGIARLHNRPVGDPVTRGLGDVGLSVSGVVHTGTSLSLAYGWPVWDRNLPEKEVEALSRSRLYFSLNQSF